MRACENYARVYTCSVHDKCLSCKREELHSYLKISNDKAVCMAVCLEGYIFSEELPIRVIEDFGVDSWISRL